MSTPSSPKLVSGTAEIRYISPRMAKSIVAQCGNVRPTTETLQAVNSFLDEIIQCCAGQLFKTSGIEGRSPYVKLEQVKSAFGALLVPGPLHTNLVANATYAINQQLKAPRPPHQGVSSGAPRIHEITDVRILARVLRARCLYYSTLGGDGGGLRASWETDVVDLPSAVFLASAIEFIGIYALQEAAKHAIQKERNLVRMQDVYHVLTYDAALSSFFVTTNTCYSLKMHLKIDDNQHDARNMSSTTLNGGVQRSPPTSYGSNASSQQRAAVNNAPTTEQVRSPRLSSQSSTRISSDTNNNASRGGYRRGSSDVTSPKGSMESSSGEVWRVMSNNPALSSRDGPIEFEDLLRGQETIKVSLTPNRLNHIEDARNVTRYQPREAQKSNTSLLTGQHLGNASKGSSVGGDAADDLDDLSDDDANGGRPQRRGETLYEFLRNTGPEDLNPVRRTGIRKQVSMGSGLDAVREEGSESHQDDSMTRSSTLSPGQPGTLRARNARSLNTLRARDDDDDDEDDDDDDDDEFLPEGQKRRPKPKQESLAEFLRNTEPPPMPPSPGIAPSIASTSSRRSTRGGVMKLFSRFGVGGQAGSSTEDVSRRPPPTSASSMIETPKSPTQRHIAIKIPYTPPIPEPMIYASPPPSATRSAHALHTSTPSQQPPVSQAKPEPPVSQVKLEPEVKKEDHDTQTDQLVTPTESKAINTVPVILVDAEVQTDPVVITLPAPEPEKKEVPQEEVRPEDIPLPDEDDDDEIDFLETESEREAARRRREEERLRVPETVMALIREALPELIETGETEVCMQFLEELLASGNTVRAKHIAIQTNQSGPGWLFQTEQKAISKKSVPTSDASTAGQFAVTERPARRHSIC